jgi:carotenoid cleavage dioxygenase
VLPREGDSEAVVWCDVDPCFVFHPLNAYDTDDGRIIADVIRHPQMFAERSAMPGGGAPILVRWTIDPSTGSVSEDIVSGRNQEFPRVDERVVGRPHRYGYGVYSGGGSLYAGAVKNDLLTGESEYRDHGPGRFCQEPVFVPRTPTSDEDDGWLLAYVHDDNIQSADVEIWESRDFTGDPVALVHLPQRVPFGFHGNWVPDSA